jgi:protein-L-isoaspartate(D-aspartate) O-methyltransferase
MIAFSLSTAGAAAGSLLLGFCCVGCTANPGPSADEAEWTRERHDMVAVLKRYGIRDERVLAAMDKVRRHKFIPAAHRQRGVAYGDHPWQIGQGQTISQPFIVAYMTEKLMLQPGEKILEIGTGSGYQAAVLAELGVRVYTIEIIPELAEHARTILTQEGYTNAVNVLTGDGYKGWPDQQPFDAVIVTCAPENVPVALVQQLKEGGRMIVPVGAWMDQRLVILRKRAGNVEKTDDLPVRFVPMVKGQEP